MASGSGRRVNTEPSSGGSGYEKGLIPVDRSLKGSGAAGNSFRATPRSPPCRSGAANSGSTMAAALTLLALLIELMVGYPDWLARAIGHPVTWMGRLVGALDQAWNRPNSDPDARRMLGVLGVLVLVLVTGGASWALQRI